MDLLRALTLDSTSGLHQATRLTPLGWPLRRVWESSGIRAMAAASLTPGYLERLGLSDAHSFKDLLIRRLFSGNV
jgi:hypothetical protein